MEVGAHSRWASHLLKDLGHDVLVANARKPQAIYHNPRKGDRADAETLARLARLDPALLAPIQHRSPQAQAELAVLRSRDAIVRCRTSLINHARDIVKASGLRLPSCSADSFALKVAPDIPEPLRPALAPSSTPSLPSPSRSNPMTKRPKCFAAYATRKPCCSVGSAVWGHSLPWPSSSRLKTPITSAGAAESVLLWDLSPTVISPAITITSYASPRLAILICVVCSSPQPNISWGLLDQIATCDVRD